MSIGAYYVLIGCDGWDLPYRESIRCASIAFDRVVVLIDERFEDGTEDAIRKIADEQRNIEVVREEIDFDHPMPLADWKNRARTKTPGDWLLEMEPWWVFDPSFRPRLDRQLSDVRPGVLCMGLGLLSLFNGDHVKRSLQDMVPVLSSNHPQIMHGSPERFGAGLMLGTRTRLKPSQLLVTGNWRDRRSDPAFVWMWNYEFYCLPTTYEMKRFWHYIKGKMQSPPAYRTLSDYEVDLDGEPVDMFAPAFRLPLEMYEQQIALEMRDAAIEPTTIRHLPIMDDWITRQRIVMPERWARMRETTRLMSRGWNALRGRLKRSLF